MRSIEPKLLELNPKSVIKVYMLIRKFTDFDIKYIDSFQIEPIFKDKKYSLEEKYFICLYLPQYLNLKSSNSYVSKRIKEIEDLGDPEDVMVVNKIREYAQNINFVCKINQTKYKRRYDKFIKTKINLDKEEGRLDSSIHNWKKLPIEKELRENFLDYIYNQLEPFYSKDIIKTIITNSFHVSAFEENIRFLDIEYENSGEIHIAFRNICNSYKEINPTLLDIVDSIEKKASKQRNTSKSIIRNKFKTYKNKEQYTQTTLDFAKIMFMTFSKVRENYILNKKHKIVEEYLRNSVCKNL